MFKSLKKFFTAFLILVAVPLIALFAFAVEIEISPTLKGQEYYIMKLGETQTFKVQGFGWDKKAQQKLSSAEIKAIRWSFDSRFLVLIKDKGESITLKAIKDRTSKLTVTGEINNEQVSKTIFIVIKKDKKQVDK